MARYVLVWLIRKVSRGISLPAKSWRTPEELNIPLHIDYCRYAHCLRHPHYLPNYDLART